VLTLVPTTSICRLPSHLVLWQHMTPVFLPRAPTLYRHGACGMSSFLLGTVRQQSSPHLRNHRGLQHHSLTQSPPVFLPRGNTLCRHGACGMSSSLLGTVPQQSSPLLCNHASGAVSFRGSRDHGQTQSPPIFLPRAPALYRHGACGMSSSLLGTVRQQSSPFLCNHGLPQSPLEDQER
jgi:hypothetical protein